MAERTCSIEGCGKKHKARGYCNAHYRLLLKHGDPAGVRFKTPPTPDQKWCSRCEDFRPLDAFGKHSSKKDGLTVYCRPCIAGYIKQNDPDGSKRRAFMERYSQENAEQIRAYHREWKRREYASKPDEVKERQYAWRRRNPEIVKHHNDRKRAKRKAAPVVPFTPDKLAARLAYFGNRCWLCGDEANSVDHVKPLSKGGAHALCNIRPACQSCNSRKGARWPLLL